MTVSSCINEQKDGGKRTRTNASQPSVYTKKFVEDELSDITATRAAGIDLSLEDARAVLMLWSRVIAHGQGKSRDLPYVAARFITLIVAAHVPVSAGEVLVPLIRRELSPKIPCGKTVLKRLQLESREISSLWDQTPTFPTSCLPLDLVLEFLPAGAWPAVATFIGCRQHELSPRIHEALRQRGKQAGAAPLRMDLTCLWLVMRTLITLNRELHGENEARAGRAASTLALPSGLHAWRVLPERPSSRELASKAKGGRGRLSTSAVPTGQIREALADRARKAEWGKRSPLEWPLNRNWRALKGFTVLCLLVTACPRADHLRLLDVDDFDPTHTFDDGSSGPGLRFRRSAMKNGGDSDDAYWKRLPSFVGDVLTAWITCSGRKIGQADAPLLISTCTREPGDPGTRYNDGSSLSKFVSGRPRQRPLVPLPEDEWRGYAPHRFRSTVTQTVERRFAAWKLDHPSHPLAAYDPRVIGELAIDHTIPDLGYRDYKDRRRLEEILGLAISLCWEECWGEGMQRLGLDPEAIVEARDATLLLEAELTMTAHQVAALEAEQAEILHRARTASSDHDRLRALVDLQTIGSGLQTRLRRELELKDRLIEVGARLEHARTTRVRLPEDLAGADYERKLAEALAEPSWDASAPGPSLTAPLADELAVADLADLFGVDPVTIRRWRAGKSTPPINPEAWIKVNAKDWRYPVSAIDDRALRRIPADDPRAALDAIRQKRAALGFGRSRQKLEAPVTAA
jgi:hypothetical protein